MTIRHLPDKFSGLAPRPLQRILVGVADGDETVLRTAAAIALATRAHLDLVHAVEASDADWLLSMNDLRVIPDPGLQAAIERWLPPQVERSLDVAPGAAHRVLADAAARLSPDLVVIGASRNPGKLLGSTAERLARKATVPVLVVRGSALVAPQRVVAPVDLSDLSACGFHYGVGIASQLAGGRELQLQPLYAIGFLDPVAHEMREHGWTIEEMTRRARRRLEELVQARLPDVASTSEPEVVLGPAPEAIVDAARQAGADLVVLSTHGRGGFERLMLGSVAASVLREAPCSVLLVSPAAAYGDDLAAAVISQTALGKVAAG